MKIMNRYNSGSVFFDVVLLLAKSYFLFCSTSYDFNESYYQIIIVLPIDRCVSDSNAKTIATNKDQIDIVINANERRTKTEHCCLCSEAVSLRVR